MKPSIENLTASDCVLADGAWGTEFQKLGLEAGAPPEHWSLIQPAKVLQVARSYVEAGSQVILTNTFGANAFVLSRHDLQDRLEEINHRGAELSKEAAGDRALVFGSMGPTGRLIQTGEVTEEEIYDSYRRQSEALWRGGADALLVETMIDIDEMRIAARAAREATPLPVVLSMTFDSGRDKTRTMMGATPEQAAAAMEAAGAAIVGANCGLGPEFYVEVCRRLRASTPKPVWVKPNAGIPRMVDDSMVYSQTPETFGAFAVRLREAGATVIGGCCGTTPDHIRHLSRILGRDTA